MTNKTKIIIAIAGVLLLLFGVWSYTGKNRAEKRALVSEGKANELVQQAKDKDLAVQEQMKLKDKEIAGEKTLRVKTEKERDGYLNDKTAITAKYNIILGSIAGKPPDDVVKGIVSYIGPEVTLLSSDAVQFTMIGSRTTLKLFVQGSQDKELLIKEQNISLTYKSDIESLNREKKKVEDKVVLLQGDVDSSKLAIGGMTKNRDEWKTTAEKALKWTKIEAVPIAIAVVLVVLKLVKII